MKYPDSLPQNGNVLGLLLYRLKCRRGRVYDRRRRDRENRSIDGVSDEGQQAIEPVDLLPQASQVLGEREQQEHIRRALQMLPDQARRIVEMYALDGRTFDDIRAPLNLTDYRVREIYHRAITELRRAIADDLDDESVPEFAKPASERAEGRRLGFDDDGNEVLMYPQQGKRKQPYITSNGTKVCFRRADMESMTLERALTLLHKTR